MFASDERAFEEQQMRKYATEKQIEKIKHEIVIYHLQHPIFTDIQIVNLLVMNCESAKGYGVEGREALRSMVRTERAKLQKKKDVKKKGFFNWLAKKIWTLVK